jgi:GNAT superfamily N-acetyltransferase
VPDIARMPMVAAEARTARDVAVRRARPDDAQALARLATALGYASSAEAMRLRLQDAEGAVLVAIDEEHAAVRGFAHVQRDAGLLATPYARLRALVVDECARNRGIGASLLAAAERWALDAGRRSARAARGQQHRARTRAPFLSTPWLQRVQAPVRLHAQAGVMNSLRA